MGTIKIKHCAGMTVLKEINIKHRRHPRAGGDRDYKNKALCGMTMLWFCIFGTPP